MKLLGHCRSRWDGTLWGYRGFGVPQAPVNNPSPMLYKKNPSKSWLSSRGFSEILLCSIAGARLGRWGICFQPPRKSEDREPSGHGLNSPKVQAKGNSSSLKLFLSHIWSETRCQPYILNTSLYP